MILRFLKNNQAYHFVTIPLMVAGLWFRAYLYPELYPFYNGEDQMPLYQLVSKIGSVSVLGSNILAMVLAVLLAFFILKLNTSYSFIRVRSFLPSIIFVLIASGVTSLHCLHPVYFGALFLLLAANRIFGAYEKDQVNRNAFDAGFYIGLGSLFYFNLIFFFPMVWIGFMLIRKNPEWRNFVIPIVGILIPWLYAFSFYFLTDSLPELGTNIVRNVVSPVNLFDAGLPIKIYLGLLIFLTLLGSFFLVAQMEEKKVSSRKYFQIFFVIFIISMLVLLLIPSASQEMLIVIAIPLSFLFANYLIFMRRQFWGNLFIYLLIGMVIYLQFIH
ncbi:MAG: DUF6427 family protein [Mangrovibacterium sp.]